MRRRFKLLAVLVGVAAALAVLVVVVVPMLVDSDHFRREVIALVRERTGHTLYVDGDVRLHVFPGLRLTVTHIRVANPPGFDSPDLVRLPWLMVDVKPLPLLGGRVEANAIHVSGLRLHLERDRSGRGNWSIPSPAGRDGATESPLAAFALGGLEMRDATVHWRDQIDDTSASVSDVTLETGELHAGGIDDLRLQATLPESGAAVEVRGDIRLDSTDRTLSVPELTATFRDLAVAGMQVDGTLSGRVALNPVSQRLTFDHARASARAAGTGAQHATVQIITALDVDLARQRLTANALSLNVPKFSLAGLDGELALKGVLSGDLGTGSYTLEQMQGTGTTRGEALADSHVAFALTGALSTNLGQRRILASALEISGSIDGDRLPFRFLGDLDLSHRSKTLTATNMQLTLADWQATGTVTLRNVASPRGVQGVLDLAVREQDVAGSFAVTESADHPDGFDVRIDAVADLDMKESGFSLQGKSVVVLNASLLPSPAGDSWRVGDVQLGARLADPSLPAGTLTVELQGDLDVDPGMQTVQSDNLRVAFDDSHISGTVTVRGFDAPALRFNLEADTIDADRYLPVGGDGDPATPVAASIAAIRALDMAGELRVKRLTLKGTVMKNVRLTAAGETGGG